MAAELFVGLVPVVDRATSVDADGAELLVDSPIGGPPGCMLSVEPVEDAVDAGVEASPVERKRAKMMRSSIFVWTSSTIQIQ